MMTKAKRKDALDWARRKRDDWLSAAETWHARDMPTVAAALVKKGNRMTRLIELAETARTKTHAE